MPEEGEPFNELPSLDPAKRASKGLEGAINESETDPEVVIVDEKIREKEEIKNVEEAEKQAAEATVEVEEVLHAAPVLTEESNRQKVRLLIITKDVSITDAGSLAQRRMIELSEMFAELHIVVLSMDDAGLSKTSRLSTNVWVYPTSSKYWWKMGFDAYRVAEEQLSFAQGFRADIILAEDPFESGVVGIMLADKYERPFQVHVFEDYFDPAFKIREDHNKLRLWMARYTLKNADCVRAKSEYLKDRILEKYPKLTETTEVLPMYYNLRSWRDAKASFTLSERYPQFKFFMLHVTTFGELSHTDRVITGAARILKTYPMVGLIVLGDGPDRARQQKFTVTLGIHNQVIFDPAINESISYMKSANVLLHLSEDPEEDYVVLQAAAVGLPLVTGVAGLPGELFLDGETAFVCPNDSPPCIGEKINRLLNENLLRTKFSRGAQDMIFERIEQDYGAYMQAYRDSIERCVV
jgi:glycosyltransferase involved in cell wall biosynthesis